MGLSKIIDWLRGTRAPAAIPDALWDATLATLPFIDALDDDEKSRLRALCQDFLAQKEFTSAGGLELSDAMCISIAAQGCLPILNIGLDCYRDWVGIVVYPDEFVIPRSVEDEFGVVHEYDDVASGEAWAGGPLLISWRDAQMAGDGYNVVIHEFAHKLDMINGDADGIPPLPASIPRRAWEATLLAAYDDFCDRVDAAAECGEDSSEAFYEATGLDDYGAESPGEFFAVMSETFFEAPEVLLQTYPVLYAQLRAFYRQDPAARLASDGLDAADEQQAGN